MAGQGGFSYPTKRTISGRREESFLRPFPWSGDGLRETPVSRPELQPRPFYRLCSGFPEESSENHPGRHKQRLRQLAGRFRHDSLSVSCRYRQNPLPRLPEFWRPHTIRQVWEFVRADAEASGPENRRLHMPSGIYPAIPRGYPASRSHPRRPCIKPKTRKRFPDVLSRDSRNQIHPWKNPRASVRKDP